MSGAPRSQQSHSSHNSQAFRLLACGVALLLVTGCDFNGLLDKWGKAYGERLLDRLAPNAGLNQPPADDDDNNDNDNDNDSSPPEAQSEIIDGGRPGIDGVAVVREADGTLVFAAAKEGRLTLYFPTGGGAPAQEIAETAQAPALAADSHGHLHVAYVDNADPNALRIAYGNNAAGAWAFVDVGATSAGQPRVSLAVDATENAHVTFPGADSRLVYATNQTGAWTTEPVDAAGPAAPISAIGLTAAGAPVAAYVRNNALYYAAKTSDGWAVQSVASPAALGSPRALALASAGAAITYYDAQAPGLRLAAQAGGTWQIIDVDDGAGVGGAASLALDDRGSFHIAYRDAAAQALKHATNAGGTWAATVAASGADVGAQTDIAAAGGATNICFYGTPGLGWAQRANAGWTLDLLDSGGVVGLYASLALDAEGAPHIAYFDLTNKRLKYAEQLGAEWVIEVVDETGDTGYWPSLAVDAGGFAYIAYHDQAVGSLRFASNVLGGWVTITVDAGPDVGLHPSLALDAAGRACIVYYDAGAQELKYATDAGGVWSTERLPDAGDIGYYTSIAVDAGGTVRAAYADLTHDALKFAEGGFGGWQFTTVDASGGSGSYNSLAVGADGGVRIAYVAAQAGELRFASRPAAGGPWTTETIAGPGPFTYPSLALDDAETAQLAYFDAGAARAMYVWGGPGAWNQAVIDNGPDAGGRTSLALDAAGWVHVAYAGAASLRHAWFPQRPAAR